jgi:hypothetical protein
MFVSLRRQAADAAPGDVVDALIACHDRIRHFTAMAAALAEATAAPAVEVSAAAAGVARYFAEALPLHSADEDRSLAPRLLALPLADPLRAAVMAMTQQHGPLEEVLAAALPRWRAVAADPACLPAHAAPLRDLTARVSALWDEHLQLEESTVFPAIRALLGPAEQAAVRTEMEARRAAPP